MASMTTSSVSEVAAQRAEARRSPDPGARAPKPEAPELPLVRAWRALGRRLPGLREDLACQAMVQADLLRMAGSRWLLRLAGAGLLAVVVATTFAITAVLLFSGIAGGLAEILEGRIWLANLLTGTGGLVLLAAVIAIALRVRQRRRLQRLVRRYERFTARQQATVAAAAAGAAGAGDDAD